MACGSGSKPGSGGTGGALGANGGAAAGGTASLGGATGGGSLNHSGAPGTAGSSGAMVPPAADLPKPSEALSPFIVVDQFGYLPQAEKIAVLRNPEMGFDAAESYTPGAKYQIVDAATNTVVSELAPTAWNNGAVDEKSGDRAWRVDFSTLTTPGVYFVRDVDAKVRSDLFRVADDVYRQVLRHAFRTFFYQRAGFEKKAEFAGAGWTDAASHVGPGQDKNARLFGKTDDASTERDLSGGWYDAGDCNRYTPWTADYVVTLLRAYEETPSAFGDDFGLPDSGNGQSDLLDEVRFGLAHLVRMQSESGGVISVLGVDGASPPSSAKKASVYGPETTNATVRTGIAFAWASRIFRVSDAAYADELLARAKKAWDWAKANPAAKFENSGKVASGEQQSSDKEVALYQLGFAVALHRADADADGTLKSYFDTNYAASGLGLLNNYNAGWEVQLTELFLDYTRMPDATAAVKQAITQAFATTIAGADNLGTLLGDPDPYLAYVADYTWGSNAHKARTGCLQYDVISFGIDANKEADARRAAERYIHYIHGVNPLGLVYLSNMGGSGAAKSATTFFHTWFADKSPLWDEVGVSTYGPPPGFLVGGPNPSYDWDGVCPGNALCPSARLTPPYGQPPQKSYANFNDSWPVNSWSVTENSDGYQVYYLRLLSKFVH
ncbi:MAG: glycoside hydrolase family 9 protein [Myxococcales bacterium]